MLGIFIPHSNDANSMRVEFKQTANILFISFKKHELTSFMFVYNFKFYYTDKF